MIKSKIQILSCLIVLNCFRKADYTRIPGEPTQLSVFEQNDVKLNCSTLQTSNLHQWKHLPRGNKNPIEVSNGAQLTPKYQTYGRYNVTINSRVRRYDLLIKSIVVIDSGVFYCFEDNVERYRCNISVQKRTRNLTVTPVNTIVVAGDTARLNCSTSYSTPVYWQHVPLDSTKPEDVFLGSAGLQGPYSSQKRYRMEIDVTTGQYDVVITNITKTNAGSYTCIDKSGFGIHVSAELTILESPPTCWSNISSDGAITEKNSICGLEPDFIQLSCGLSYHGNVAPTLEWSPQRSQDTVTDSPYSAEVTTTTNKITSNLTLQARSWMSSEQFECRVKELDNMQQNYNCAVPQLKTIDFSPKNVTLEASNVMQSVVTCSNFSRIVCYFDWRDENGTSVGGGRMFPTSDGERTPGKYTCIAACSIREVNCSLSLFVNVVDNKDIETTRTLTNVTIVIIIIAISSLITIIAILMCLKQSRLNNCSECRKHGPDVDQDNQNGNNFWNSSQALITRYSNERSTGLSFVPHGNGSSRMCSQA